MHRKITWKGIYSDTEEECNLQFLPHAIEVSSAIKGMYEGRIINVMYNIILANDWTVREFKVNGTVGDKEFFAAMIRHPSGVWQDVHQNENIGFAGYDYIDISLTPFTNTLPIKGLQLEQGKTKEINVVYIDVANNQLRTDRQFYTRLGTQLFRFENDEGNFTADINVDKEGFVTDYPGLFKKININEN